MFKIPKALTYQTIGIMGDAYTVLSFFMEEIRKDCAEGIEIEYPLAPHDIHVAFYSKSDIEKALRLVCDLSYYATFVTKKIETEKEN